MNLIVIYGYFLDPSLNLSFLSLSTPRQNPIGRPPPPPPGPADWILPWGVEKYLNGLIISRKKLIVINGYFVDPSLNLSFLSLSTPRQNPIGRPPPPPPGAGRLDFALGG